MMQLKRLNKTLLLCGFIVLFMGILNLQSAAAAEFSETYDINNDWIDGSKDSFYSLEYNGTEAVYFAYSAVRYALYLESNETITSLKVNSTSITSNFEDADIIVKFNGKQAEFVITKAKFTNPIFAITVNNHSTIILDPFDLLVPVPTETSTTTTPTETTTNTTTTNTTTNTTDTPVEGVDLVAFTKAIFLNPLTYFLASIMVVILMDLKRHPIVFITENGKAKLLGKYISSYHNEKLKKWENYFSDKNGISIYYSNLEFNSYWQFLFHSWLGIQYAFPSLRLIQLSLGDRTDIVKRIPKPKNFKNSILHIIMGLFYFTPASGLVKKCADALTCDTVILDKMPLIIPDVQLEANEYKFKITYEKEELDPETNTMVWKPVTKENLYYSDYVSLLKSNVKNLQAILVGVDIKQYPSIKEADEDKRTRNELINNYEKRILDLEHEYLLLQDRLQLTLSDLSDLKRNFNEKLYEQLRKLRDILANQGSDVVEIISNKLELQKVGHDEIKSLKGAIQQYIDDSKQDYEKLKEENATLKGYLKGLKAADAGKEDDYLPNQIIIKTDKSEKSENSDRFDKAEKSDRHEKNEKQDKDVR